MVPHLPIDFKEKAEVVAKIDTTFIAKRDLVKGWAIFSSEGLKSMLKLAIPMNGNTIIKAA